MIPIKNVYYMLTYVYETLNENGYKDVDLESFSDDKDLLSAILIKGVSLTVKKGLLREYVSYEDELGTVKGKINISNSLKKLTLYRKKIICDYDEYSINNQKNQIIKTILYLLLKSDINKKNKNCIRHLLTYFSLVDTIDLSKVNWHFRFNRNDKNYKLILNICYLINFGLLQTDKDGNTRINNYINYKLMYHLYERFILEYYRKEYPALRSKASQIPWKLDDDCSEMLPIMQSDITLSDSKNVLIIDAKYYINNFNNRYDKTTAISNNLYQIFTYVKNKQYDVLDKDQKVSGLLLYAKTDNLNINSNDYKMSGNTISISTIDLSVNFNEVKGQLNAIVNKYFNQAL